MPARAILFDLDDTLLDHSGIQRTLALRLFRPALDALGVAAEYSVMVGDSWPLDIEGARAAGIRAVWFNRFGAAPGDGEPVTQLTSYDDIDAALEAIDGR